MSAFGIPIFSANGSNNLPVQSTFSSSLGGDLNASLMGLGGNELNNSNSPTSRFTTPSVQKNVFGSARTQTTEAVTQRQRQVGALNLDDIKVCFYII